MILEKANNKIIRYTLGILLFVLAINAFGGGYYGIAGAQNIPIEWLEDSPFNSYLFPSLILFICVGGSALLAAILVFKKHPHAQTAAVLCGIIVVVWLVVQLAIIGYVSWMQPATAIANTLILLLAWKLPLYEH